MGIAVSVQNAWSNFVRIAKADLTDQDKQAVKECVADIAAHFVANGLPKDYYKEDDCFSECPRIPEAKEMIERTRAFFKAHPDAPTSTEAGGAEVASIGHDYTYHTHPNGTAAPSDADIQTTLRLKRQFLCIGLVPKNKVVCYDMKTGGLACEHGI